MADVSNLTVCDPSIKNGDIVYITNQADTGYTGYITIIHVNQMQADAQSTNECQANISHWIANHPFGNGVYWELGSSQNPSSSNSTQNANVIENITFTQIYSSVVFVANGLPDGTEWQVTLNGQTKTSTNNTIVFEKLPPGTYQFTVFAKGFLANPSSGTITIGVS